MISASNLSNLKIQAEDGQAGSIKDVLFDDKHWKVRHFVVETGGLLTKHQVMVDPTEAMMPDEDSHLLPVSLTKDEVKHHPDVASDPPRSHEFAKKRGPSGTFSPAQGGPTNLMPDTTVFGRGGGGSYGSDIETDPHLRSAGDVIDYNLSASGVSVGKVSDFLVDPSSWDVPYAIVKLDDRSVLLPTSMVRSVGWPDKMVITMVPPERLREAPAFEDMGDYDMSQLENFYSEGV